MLEVMGEEKFNALLGVHNAAPWGERRMDWRFSGLAAAGGNQTADRLFWDSSLAAMKTGPIDQPKKASADEIREKFKAWRQRIGGKKGGANGSRTKRSRLAGRKRR